MVLAAPPHELRKKVIPMAQIIGKEISIVPRVPYVPIEPWDWFKEMGIEDKMGGPPPMGAGVSDHAKLTLKDCLIDTWGLSRTSTSASGGSLESAQIDAPAGVTVTAKAASGQGTYTLSSGGTLVVE